MHPRHVVHELGPEVDELLERREFFWLDLRKPTAEEIDAVGQRFGLNHLAAEDTREMGQRSKYDDYGDTALMVVYGMDDKPWPCEVHVHLGDGWMVTVHTPPCPALDDAEARFVRDPPQSHEEALYRVVDALTDSFWRRWTGWRTTSTTSSTSSSSTPAPTTAATCSSSAGGSSGCAVC